MAVLGRYQLLARLAVGGMAEVFLARNLGTAGFNKVAAVKRILPGFASNAEFVEMFTNEARLCGQLSHPNIVQSFEFGQEADTYFLAMEFVDGPTLRQLMRAAAAQKQRLPIGVVLRIISQVLEGLEYAHTFKGEDGRALRLVHRDISPHNVLMGRNGSVKVADFGIAKAASIPSVTKTGQIKGKVRYMSPEQLNDQPLDARSDVFAAGITLYEALTGQRPFVGQTEAEVMAAIVNATPPPLASVLGPVPEILQTVIDRSLAKSRDDRYATASQMQADVEAALVKLGVAVRGTEIAALIEALCPPNPEVSAALAEPPPPLGVPESAPSGPAAEPRPRPVSVPGARRLSDPNARALSEPGARPVSNPGAKRLSNPGAKPLSDPRAKPLSNPSARPLSDPNARPLAPPRTASSGSRVIVDAEALEGPILQGEDPGAVTDTVDAVARPPAPLPHVEPAARPWFHQAPVVVGGLLVLLLLAAGGVAIGIKLGEPEVGPTVMVVPKPAPKPRPQAAVEVDAGSGSGSGTETSIASAVKTTPEVAVPTPSPAPPVEPAAPVMTRTTTSELAYVDPPLPKFGTTGKGANWKSTRSKWLITPNGTVATAPFEDENLPQLVSRLNEHGRHHANGTVEVKVHPHAIVSIDDQNLGMVQEASRSVEAGEHLVRVWAVTGQNQSFKIYVGPNQTRTLRLNF